MIFERLTKAWKLATKDQEKLDALTTEQIDAMPDMGDGKAVFLGEGSEEDYKEQEKEDKGLKGIFGL